MGAQADILAYIAGGGANKIPKYGDVEKEQLSLQETRAKANDLRVAEEQRQKQAKDVKLLNDSFTGARGDLKQTRERYIKNGGGTAVLMAWEDANSKMRKAIGEADEQTARATALQATQLAQAMTGYRALPPEQQAQVRPHVEAELRQAGHLAADEQLDDAHAALLEARGRAFADITSRITADANAKKAAQDAAKTADEIAKSQALRESDVSAAASQATIAAENAKTVGAQNAAKIRLENAQALEAETKAATPPKIETETVDLMVGGKPHQVMVEKGTGKLVRDLGEKGSMAGSADVGTWSIQEDSEGKPVMFNSKTAVVRPVDGLQKTGTAAKAAAALEKEVGPARDAVKYGQGYLQNGVFTGSGDEALQEKFFELAKPSTGFRMTKAQMDMLQQSRGWMEGIGAKVRHATSGTWFSDEQRQQIVKTMEDLAAAKVKGATEPGASEEMVRMMAPNGDIQPVPKSKVEAYKKAGAKVVGN